MNFINPHFRGRERLLRVSQFYGKWFQMYAHREYRYILVVIHCYSKYVWTDSLKSKRAQVVTNAIETVLNNAKYFPKNVQNNKSKFY